MTHLKLEHRLQCLIRHLHLKQTSNLIGEPERSVNISEQEAVMHEIGSDASDDEGILKRNFLINYKCKNCGGIFSNTTDEERSD